MKYIIHNFSKNSEVIMKIIRLTQQMIVPTPGGTQQQNIGPMIINLQKALPTLNNLKPIIDKANQIHELAADLGNDIGMPGLADQVLGAVQQGIANNTDFANLIQIGLIGSVNQLFESGFLDLKITKITEQLQEAQQAQAGMTQAQQGMQNAAQQMGY